MHYGATLCYTVSNMIPIDPNIKKLQPQKYVPGSAYVHLGYDYRNDLTWAERSARIDEIYKWLCTNIGTQGDSHADADPDEVQEAGLWYWRRGDRYAQGIYFVKEEDATLFKLTFNI